MSKVASNRTTSKANNGRALALAASRRRREANGDPPDHAAALALEDERERLREIATTDPAVAADVLSIYAAQCAERGDPIDDDAIVAAKAELEQHIRSEVAAAAAGLDAIRAGLSRPHAARHAVLLPLLAAARDAVLAYLRDKGKGPRVGFSAFVALNRVALRPIEDLDEAIERARGRQAFVAGPKKLSCAIVAAAAGVGASVVERAQAHRAQNVSRKVVPRVSGT